MQAASLAVDYPNRFLSRAGAGLGGLLTLVSLLAWVRLAHASQAALPYQPALPGTPGPICLMVGLTGIAVAAISLFLRGRIRGTLLVALAIPAIVPISLLSRWAGMHF